MKTIITIQHAQSIQHVNGMVGSWTDWNLTDLGFAQAERIGKNLAPELSGKPLKFYCSDLTRAKFTAKPLANRLGITPIYTPILRERNLGEACGKSKSWTKEHSLLEEKTVDDRAFFGAETRRDCWNRLLPFYQELLESSDELIVIVSHGDTLSILNGMWLGWEPEMLNRCDLRGMPGGVTFLTVDADGKRIIRRLSDMYYAKHEPSPLR